MADCDGAATLLPTEPAAVAGCVRCLLSCRPHGIGLLSLTGRARVDWQCVARLCCVQRLRTVVNRGLSWLFLHAQVSARKGCRRGALVLGQRCRSDAPELGLRCRRDALVLGPRCRRGALVLGPRWRRDALVLGPRCRGK